ncbi:metallophosphoesterase [Chitinilyticum aquatile]|uniref:metallophosphoesterase n=1 Tax=Chitinilyticum aquatile TaxID=362520 RepID=UPI000401C05E|nr:metallophosphoesterase [Chitinilyticum aquatile]
MKIWILSDLHIDIYPFQVEEPDADLAIIAGDVSEGFKGLQWVRRNIKNMPTLYVPGNHEYYGECLEQHDALMCALQHQSPSVLQCRSVIHGDVRFLGCTLWTDYQLFGSEQQLLAMIESERRLTDHRMIRSDTAGLLRLFSSADALAIHQQHRQWLSEALAIPFHGKTVVITHHAPHPGSVHPRFADSTLSAAFASNLAELMDGVDLWVHGHCHDNSDYVIGKTRIICNPRGYVSHNRVENPAFQDTLIVEL